jgi:hypothetical protein
LLGRVDLVISGVVCVEEENLLAELLSGEDGVDDDDSDGDEKEAV